jgi:hypothetical protein
MSETAKDHPRILVGFLNLFILNCLFALLFVATFAIDMEVPSEKNKFRGI